MVLQFAVPQTSQRGLVVRVAFKISSIGLPLMRIRFEMRGFFGILRVRVLFFAVLL